MTDLEVFLPVSDCVTRSAKPLSSDFSFVEFFEHSVGAFKRGTGELGWRVLSTDIHIVFFVYSVHDFHWAEYRTVRLAMGRWH